MSHLVIHKIDIGKVKTSKNVMKLLKLLLTVIVKHPVYLGSISLSILRLLSIKILQSPFVNDGSWNILFLEILRKSGWA